LVSFVAFGAGDVAVVLASVHLWCSNSCVDLNVTIGEGEGYCTVSADAVVLVVKLGCNVLDAVVVGLWLCIKAVLGVANDGIGAANWFKAWQGNILAVNGDGL